MAKEVIFQAETVEKAIEIGLKQLRLERSQVDIEVISEPRKSIFGFPTRSAAVKLIVKDDYKHKSEINNDGTVWVEHGELKYSPPDDGGRYPIIIFDSSISVTYNGVELHQRLELNQGLKPLKLTLPPEETPVKEVAVFISPDKLKAYLHITRSDGFRYYLEDQPPSRLLELKLRKEPIPAPPVTTEEMVAALRNAGVVYGLKTEKLSRTVYSEQEEILAAIGKVPVPPQDGYIKYEFKDEESEPDLDLDADRIDYYELKPVPSVNSQDVLAHRVLGVPGEEGINVLGEPIPVAEPKNPQLLVGEGVRLSDDQLTALAERAGLPVVHNGILKVLKVFELNSDANLETGNIRFNGEIVVRGSVTDQVRIEAVTGGVQVFGMVDQAYIEAEGNVVIRKNAIAAEIKAGGVSAVFTRAASYLHKLSVQFGQLIQAYFIVGSHMVSIDAGTIIKNLIEIKFNAIPKMIREFDADFGTELDLFSPDFRTLLLELKHYFLDRGPLRIGDITFVQQLIDRINFWQSEFQKSSDETADVQVGYLQNTTIEASGIVRVQGKGVYYSNIIAGRGYYQPQGVFRNSHVTVRTGNIEVKEMGSRSGSAASASITTEGKILIGAVHPNVTVAYRNQKYQFLQPATNVKVLWHEDGIVVYSGKQKLT